MTFPFHVPRSGSDLEKLVSFGARETVNLEFKRLATLRDRKTLDITSAVSAFANSAGGALVFGVEERNGVAISLEAGLPRRETSSEWIDQVISSNVSPRIEGIDISVLEREEDHCFVVIAVPRSRRAPHQAQDKKYYKRSNNRCEPMEDYEVRDVSNRLSVEPRLISVDVVIHNTIAYVVIRSVGTLPALDVQFETSGCRWGHGEPPLLARGIRSLPPGQSLPFFYAPMVTMFDEESANKFTIGVRYTDPATQERVAEDFRFDLEDYRGSAILSSDLELALNPVVEHLKGIRGALEEVRRSLKTLEPIAGATGLDLSFTALRNLASIEAGASEPIKPSPLGVTEAAFAEIMGLDARTAYDLHLHFRSRRWARQHPISEELLRKVEGFFDLSAWRKMPADE